MLRRNLGYRLGVFIQGVSVIWRSDYGNVKRTRRVRVYQPPHLKLFALMKWDVQPFIVVPCPSSSASLSFLFLLFFPISWWEGTVFVAGDTTLARFLHALSPTTSSASPTCCHLPNTAESGDNQTFFILSVSDLGFWAKRESVWGGGGECERNKSLTQKDIDITCVIIGDTQLSTSGWTEADIT